MGIFVRNTVGLREVQSWKTMNSHKVQGKPKRFKKLTNLRKTRDIRD